MPKNELSNAEKAVKSVPKPAPLPLATSMAQLIDLAAAQENTMRRISSILDALNNEGSVAGIGDTDYTGHIQDDLTTHVDRSQKILGELGHIENRLITIVTG